MMLPDMAAKIYSYEELRDLITPSELRDAGAESTEPQATDET